MTRKTKPIHPSEILQEDFLKPLEISQYRVAKDIGVQPTRINQIVKGKMSITAQTALRLGKYFGMSAQFWVNAQSYYDLEIAFDKIKDKLEKEVTTFEAA